MGWYIEIMSVYIYICMRIIWDEKWDDIKTYCVYIYIYIYIELYIYIYEIYVKIICTL